MARITFESTNLAWADYDPETKSLVVEFTGGAIYEYEAVPEWVIEDLARIAAGEFGSAGIYFNEAIRKGGYKYRRVK